MRKSIPFIKQLLILVLVFTLSGIGMVTKGQVVKHPLSGISTTGQWYAFYYQRNPTTGVEVDYFVIEAPNTTLKTCLDACDVCYGQYKGFTQLGNFIRCTNCGNTYPTNDVGTIGQGGCWPAYLPHTTDANDLIINESDIIAGEWMFEGFAINTGVSEVNGLPSGYVLKSQEGQMVISMPLNTERTINLVGINGQIAYTATSSSNELVIKTSNMAQGIYVLSVLEEGKLYNKQVRVN